jgi:hypothetical protein
VDLTALNGRLASERRPDRLGKRLRTIDDEQARDSAGASGRGSGSRRILAPNRSARIRPASSGMMSAGVASQMAK